MSPPRASVPSETRSPFSCERVLRPGAELEPTPGASTLEEGWAPGTGSACWPASAWLSAIFVAGAVPRWQIAALVGAVAGAVLGVAIFHWYDGVAGAAGGAAGGFGAGPIVVGALRRGGTRGGLATLIRIGALATAALAFVPVVGFLEAVVVPAVGLRLRRRTPERHAGLRTLARD